MLETRLQDQIERYKQLVAAPLYVEEVTLANPELGDLFFYLPNNTLMMLDASLSLAQIKKFGPRDLAIPPLHVRDAFRYVNVRLSENGNSVVAEYVHGGGRFYTQGEDLNTRFQGASLDPNEVNRSKATWLQRNLQEFLAGDEILEFLPLQSDTWADVVGIQFRSSPTKRNVEGNELRSPLVYFCLNAPLTKLVHSGGNRLLSEKINESIIGSPFFADVGMVKELRGDRQRYCFSSCIHCGSGLLGSRCLHCSSPFEDGLYDPWACAMPEKVHIFLQDQGYIMPAKPNLARLKEKMAPATTGPMPTVFAATDNTTVVDLRKMK